MSEILYSLGGIKLIEAGGTGADAYTEEDLRNMVDAFSHHGFFPPVLLGADTKEGSQSFGLVTSLVVRGTTLSANLKDLPKKVYDALYRGTEGKINIGTSWDTDRNGKKFRRVLRFVNFPEIDPASIGNFSLEKGGSMQAEHDMKDLRKTMDRCQALLGEIKVNNQYGLLIRQAEEVKLHMEEVMEKKSEKKVYANHIEAGAELNRRVKAYLFENPKRDYREAMDHFLNEDPDLKKAYSMRDDDVEVEKISTGDKGTKYLSQVDKNVNTGIERHGAAEKIADLAEKYISDHPGIKYGDALKTVLKENPALKAAYNS